MEDTIAEHLNLALLSAGGERIPVGRREGVPPTVVGQMRAALARSKIAKPKRVSEIRTIHHLSCTGGTLFAKCIASMPNTLLLNEIDLHIPIPMSRQDRTVFTPTDMISLLRQGDRDVDPGLVTQLFLNDLRLVKEEQEKIGRTLVLRDHSHSHFLLGHEVSSELTLLEQLKPEFSLKSVVSVRHPIDCYASMVALGWHKQFEPHTFEEYCRRYLLFLDAYEGVSIVKYEDFIRAPKTTMRKICRILGLSYYSDFDEVFSSFRFSGDSGRGGEKIINHERRQGVSAESLEAGVYYDQLCERLSYT